MVGTCRVDPGFMMRVGASVEAREDPAFRCEIKHVASRSPRADMP